MSFSDVHTNLLTNSAQFIYGVIFRYTHARGGTPEKTQYPYSGSRTLVQMILQQILNSTQKQNLKTMKPWSSIKSKDKTSRRIKIHLMLMKWDSVFYVRSSNRSIFWEMNVLRNFKSEVRACWFTDCWHSNYIMIVDLLSWNIITCLCLGITCSCFLAIIQFFLSMPFSKMLLFLKYIVWFILFIHILKFSNLPQKYFSSFYMLNKTQLDALCN